MEEPLHALYRAHFNEAVEKSAPLKGDGSGRRLVRLAGKRHGAIGVIGPDRRENRAFLEFSRHFRAAGLPVPEIYAQEEDKGIYLEEDLGDTTLFKLLSASRAQGKLERALEVYREAVRLLPRFQVSAGKTLDYRFCHPRASFDKQSMMWDLNYFKYYFLRLAKVPFNEQDLEDDFERFADFLLQADRNFFLYRDFQSRNIMVREGAPYFIDYQGGRKGALQYDIAALLFDAKADLPLDAREDLLDRYIEAVSALVPLDRARFMKYYPGFAYIRILQAMGAYGLRGFYEQKSRFLQSIPYAVRNLEFLLRTAPLPLELPALTDALRHIVASSTLRQYGGVSLKLTVRVQSFSYRNGMPADEKGHGGGFVFDCRALPNPGRYEKYAQLTGQDAEVVSFLEKEDSVGRFMSHIHGLVDQVVENYRARNFTDLLVAFGCTGGRHRSVYCAELLAKRLREKYAVDVELRHREQEGGAA